MLFTELQERHDLPKLVGSRQKCTFLTGAAGGGGIQRQGSQ